MGKKAQADTEFSEIGIGAILAAHNPLVDEGIGLAFGANGKKTDVDMPYGIKAPDQMTPGGNSGPSLTFNRNFWGTLTDISIDANRDGTADGTAKAKTNWRGRVKTVSIDYNNDGKVDATAKVNRYPILGLTSIEFDTDGDGKTDLKLKSNMGFYKASGMYIDIGNNGTNDYYMKFKRGLLGLHAVEISPLK